MDVWYAVIYLVAGAALVVLTLGIAIGVAGMSTLVPLVQDAAASLFGLGFIAWYLWFGRILLRA